MEIKDANHNGEQTETMGVTEEATTHTLWRSKLKNTVINKLGHGCDRRSCHLHAVEMKDAEHSGE